jgi:RNA polymerase sigma-70 factor, ECF subfamily
VESTVAGNQRPAVRDADLLEALGQRDYSRVLSGLMLRYRQKALHLCFSIVRDRAMAEDLAQVSFVKAWQALPRFDGRAALSTWLYTIVRNTCLSELRKRGRTVSLDELIAGDDEAPGLQFAAPHDREGQAAAEYDATQLLAALPEPYRRVVTLFYLEERSVEEVAALLAMPVGTIKSVLFRARRQLAAAAQMH